MCGCNNPGYSHPTRPTPRPTPGAAATYDPDPLRLGPLTPCIGGEGVYQYEPALGAMVQVACSAPGGAAGFRPGRPAFGSVGAVQVGGRPGFGLEL